MQRRETPAYTSHGPRIIGQGERVCKGGVSDQLATQRRGNSWAVFGPPLCLAYGQPFVPPGGLRPQPPPALTRPTLDGSSGDATHAGSTRLHSTPPPPSPPALGLSLIHISEPTRLD
eukprot:12237545-Prorocentrum_lima.AAC.1